MIFPFMIGKVGTMFTVRLEQGGIISNFGGGLH